MSHDRLIVALIFVLVPCIVLNWNGEHSASPNSASIFARLRHECDPDNPEANYYWSQSSMPTERKRETIIEDCRKLGTALLPDVRQALSQEKDDELRGMLIVIAAALGDKAFVEPAAREMAWSDYPAVRISAAKALRRLRDRRTVDWFLIALNDERFVVDGACGTFREKFYPVRTIAQVALKEAMGKSYPGDADVLRLSRGYSDSAHDEDVMEKRQQLEGEALKLMK